MRGFQRRSAAQPTDHLPAAVTTSTSHSAAQPVQSPPTWRFLVCLSQMWMKKTGQAFPPFARIVLEYMGNNIHHPHQISLAQFSAYHLREIIYNLDMLAIARSTKLTATSKEITAASRRSSHILYKNIYRHSCIFKVFSLLKNCLCAAKEHG